MRLILWIVLFTALTAAGITENPVRDVVYLKNGSIVKGHITGAVDGGTIKLTTADGSLFVFNMGDVDSLSKESRPTDVENPVVADAEEPLDSTDLAGVSAEAPSVSGQGLVLSMGLSKAVGEGSDMINMGFHGQASIFTGVGRKSAFGLAVGYTRWSFDFSEYSSFLNDDIEASLSYTEFLLFARVNDNASRSTLFFQPGFGFFHGRAEISSGDLSESTTQTDVGLSIEAGARFDRIEIKPAFKMVFTEGESTKWFNVSLGLHLL